MKSIINFFKRPFCDHVYILNYVGITVVGYKCFYCEKCKYKDRFKDGGS